MGCLNKITESLFIRYAAPKIQLSHLSVSQYLHDITNGIIIKVKFLCLFMINNAHTISCLYT